MREEYLHSSQKEFPQHGIMTASVSRSRHRLQISSSGTAVSGAAGALLGVSPPPAFSDAKYASLEHTTKCKSRHLNRASAANLRRHYYLYFTGNNDSKPLHLHINWVIKNSEPTIWILYTIHFLVQCVKRLEPLNI